jgi:hypothetical protein
MTGFQSDPTSYTASAVGWLKRCNQTMLAWAASLSWTRLFFLCVIVLITSSIIADKLDLRHRRASVSIDISDGESAAEEPAFDRAAECTQDPVSIGDQKYILVCQKPVDGTAASNPAASAPVAPAKSARSKISVKTRKPEDRVQRTLGGYVSDLFSAAMIAFFAYLIAAKIIVRKTAESEARVREATSHAEHEALERQLVQARLKLLQAQVEPHFLFNTLAAVDYLIETDPPRASVMQKQLITYLRGALPQMREESSTLGREVAQVSAYLELLKMRIEDRLEFAIEVPQELFTAVFPPMVLQSVVENAIKHGIEPKPEGGKITVLAQARDGNLWVDIVDTGVGLPDGEIFGVSSNGTGLGLDNIRKRLALLYPGASRIELRSEMTGGTSVRLVIPYQTLEKHAGTAAKL